MVITYNSIIYAVFIYVTSIFLFVAAFTVCASPKTYPSGSTIIFPFEYAKYGVSDSTLLEFGSSGKYVCEKAGLYLISGFFVTGTKVYARLDFYKNNERIHVLYFSVTTGTSYQTSCIFTIQFLNIHDTVYIKSGSAMSLVGDTGSCLSFLQLTN